MAYKEALTLTELPPGERQVIEIDNTWIAVFNVDGQVYAIEDVCTHDYATLGDGKVEGKSVECPRHGAKFDLETGKPTMPAVKPVSRYAVKVAGDMILIDIENILNK